MITVPNINLNGRQSKILLTDYNFGNSTLLYSSVDVLTYGVFDVDVITFYLEEGQTGQFALETGANTVPEKVYGSTEFTATQSGSSITVIYSQGSGQTVLKFNGVLIYLLD